VVLFSDATSLTKRPSLRASRAPVGGQAEVPITGERDRAGPYGALSPATGALLLGGADVWDQRSFQDHLRNVRSRWRGWNIVLFLDRGSPHTARASRALARRLGVEMRFLRRRAPS
jgi:DDE superfamily endonuclease